MVAQIITTTTSGKNEVKQEGHFIIDDDNASRLSLLLSNCVCCSAFLISNKQNSLGKLIDLYTLFLVLVCCLIESFDDCKLMNTSINIENWEKNLTNQNSNLVGFKYGIKAFHSLEADLIALWFKVMDITRTASLLNSRVRVWIFSSKIFQFFFLPSWKLLVGKPLKAYTFSVILLSQTNNGAFFPFHLIFWYLASHMRTATWIECREQYSRMMEMNVLDSINREKNMIDN